MMMAKSHGILGEWAPVSKSLSLSGVRTIGVADGIDETARAGQRAAA
jgi:hypothetical protein